MQLKLSEREEEVLTQLALDKDMSMSAVMRQALRLYQMIDDRIKKGQQLAFTKDGVVVPVVVLSMLPPGGPV